MTDVHGNIIQYAYDETRNITEIVYPDGKSVRYTYDLLGNMESVTDYEGRVTSYEYDRNSCLIKTYYSNGIVEDIFYDSMGQVTSRTSRRGAEVITSSQYSYNGNGSIIMEIDDTAMARIDYDKNGQLIEVTDTWYTGLATFLKEMSGRSYADVSQPLGWLKHVVYRQKRHLHVHL